MAIQLNQAAYNHAAALIKNGLEVEHDTNNWAEAKPTENDIIRYLDTHDLADYGNWFLGINTDADPKDKSKYLYPTGDLDIIHKGALAMSEKEAAQRNNAEIQNAAKKLLELINPAPTNQPRR